MRAIWRGAVAAAMLLSALPLAATPARAAGDGTVLAFGADMFGQLGDGGPDDGGGYDNQSSPVAVRGLGSASGVVAVASGDGHSLALRADGSVLQWGNDDHGTPSSGALNVPSSPSPFQVAGLGPGSGVVALAAGGLQSLALRADGGVLAWGPGQHTPANVAGLGPGSGAVAVSTGAFQNLVLRSDGSVVAWPAGSPGPRLYGTTTISNTPVPVTGLEAGSGVVGISAGYTHSLAVLADGSVLAWGSDSHGQLGDGGALDQATRVNVSGLGPGSGVVAVSAGYHHSLALRGDGSVLAWGDDSVGQLGDGGTPFAVRRTPVAVRGLGPGSGVVGVSAGVGHSAAVRLDGSVLTWGWDSYSQLGDGSTGTSSTVPVAVRNLGPGSGVRAVAAGGYHTVVAKSASSTPATFAPVAPARVWDTRVGPGTTGRIGPGGARNLAVTGVGGVPAAGVTAVVLNVTAVNPSAATYVTVWPAGEARPLASNLNVPAGDTRPNLVTVKVGAFGLLSVFNEAGAVDLVADVAGWYGPTAGQRYTAVSPARVWDSRAGPGPTGRIGPGGVRDVPVAGQGGVPATGATAVVLNVTGVSPTAATYVTAWPTGQARPLASNLNLPPGDTRANLVVVPVGPSGRVSFANAAGSLDLVVDVAGWFGTAGATFTSLSPTRVWDTRAGSGPSGRMGAGGTRSIVFAGAGGVPAAGVSAVAFNLVAVGATAPTFVTAWPAGQPKPVTSNLNVPPGDSRANLVVVPVGSGGQVSFSNAAGTIDLVADVAGWYGLPQPGPPPPLPAPNPDAPPGSATTYQVNARHDGHAPGTLALPGPGAPKWTHTFIPDNVPAAISYAVTVGQRVFVAVSKSGVEPNGYNTYGVDLYALDAQTGGTLWGPVPLGDATTRAALVTADSVAVYVVRDYGTLQSFDQATGRQLWAAEVPAGRFTSPPTVAGGLLYVGAYTNEGVLFAVDTRTGLVRWTTDEVSGGEGPASVDGGSVYVSYSCNRDRRQDADRGTTIWEARPVCTGYGGRPAVLSSDSVYVGSDTGTWTRLSRETGAAMATIPGYQPPAIDGDVGLFLTSGTWDVPARLSARDLATGQVLWSATGDGRFTTPPLVVDGKVIEGSSTGRVTALDERTGAEVWSATTGFSVGPGLNAGGGLLLVPAAGTLVAFGA